MSQSDTKVGTTSTLTAKLEYVGQDPVTEACVFSITDEVDGYTPIYLNLIQL